MVKDFLLRILLVELVLPCTLEVDGVQQVAHVVRVERLLVEHLLNHLLRVVAGPLVDDVHRLPVVEVAPLRLGVVVGVGLLNERGLQLVWLVHIDGVGYRDLGRRVEQAAFGHHLAAELVDGLGRTDVGTAQYAADFLLRLSGSPVVEHPQGVGDAQRREDEIPATIYLAHQPEGEVVVLLHQPLLVLCQFNALGGIEVGGSKVDAATVNKLKTLIVMMAIKLWLKQPVYQPFPLKAHTLDGRIFQHIATAVGPRVLIFESAQLLPFHHDGLCNGRRFGECVISEMQTVVKQQEVLLVALIVVLPHPALLVLAEGAVVVEAAIVVAVHLHIVPPVDDGVASQHVAHLRQKLLRGPIVNILKVVIGVPPRLAFGQHRPEVGGADVQDYQHHGQ